MKSLCVFCGSKTGNDPQFRDAAAQLGKGLAESNIRLVFGGGHVGLMGVVADAILAHHGEVTGVIPKALQQRELAHEGVADMRVVDSMHTRKATMAELSDAFIALPGGMGTFEELCEILTWAQLEFHSKPVVILNLNGYYTPLLDLIAQGIEQGFMTEQARSYFYAATSVDDAMAYLQNAAAGAADAKAIWEQT